MIFVSATASFGFSVVRGRTRFRKTRIPCLRTRMPIKRTISAITNCRTLTGCSSMTNTSVFMNSENRLFPMTFTTGKVSEAAPETAGEKEDRAKRSAPFGGKAETSTGAARKAASRTANANKR